MRGRWDQVERESVRCKVIRVDVELVKVKELVGKDRAIGWEPGDTPFDHDHTGKPSKG